MFIVSNLTSKTIILSDLRVEIGPSKTIDLEKVAHRHDIERSKDLKECIQTSRMKIVQHSILRKKDADKLNKEVVHNSITEEKITNIVRNLLNEHSNANNIPSNIESLLTKGLDSVVNKIKDEIGSIKNNTQQDNSQNMVNESIIDPQKLADMQSRSVEKISQEIETSSTKQAKRVVIRNTNTKDLANEL